MIDFVARIKRIKKELERGLLWELVIIEKIYNGYHMQKKQILKRIMHR